MFHPVWQGRALIGVAYNRSDSPLIWGIDSQGGEERINFSIPRGKYLGLQDISGAEDGAIAVIGSAYSTKGQPGFFVSRISPDRKQNVVVQTWPYVAFAVTIGPDGVMWTMGYLKDEENQRIVKTNVMKRFDPAGKILSTSDIRGKPNPKHRYASLDSLLRSSKDRVGWLTNANEYIEFRLDGSELSRVAPRRGRFHMRWILPSR